LADSVAGNRGQVRLEKYPVGGDTSGTAGKIPQEQLSGMEPQGDGPLLVAFAVHNSIALPDMEQGERKGSYFIPAQTAVQHQGADAEVPQLEQGARIETGQQRPDFGVCEGVYFLPLGFGEPELVGKVLGGVFLPVTPSKEGPKGPDIGLEGD